MHSRRIPVYRYLLTFNYNSFILTLIRGAQFGAWCPHKINDRQWLQVDFKDVRTITAVKTQGYADDLLLYVGSYTLLYSYNGSKWYNYTVDTKVHVSMGSTFCYIPYQGSHGQRRINPMG